MDQDKAALRSEAAEIAKVECSSRTVLRVPLVARLLLVYRVAPGALVVLGGGCVGSGQGALVVLVVLAVSSTRKGRWIRTRQRCVTRPRK